MLYVIAVGDTENVQGLLILRYIFISFADGIDDLLVPQFD